MLMGQIEWQKIVSTYASPKSLHQTNQEGQVDVPVQDNASIPTIASATQLSKPTVSLQSKEQCALVHQARAFAVSFPVVKAMDFWNAAELDAFVSSRTAMVA